MIEIKLKKIMSDYSEKTGKKLTYKALAEATGVSKAAIESMGSRGQYNASLDVIDKLCGFFVCTVQDLLEYREG
jgi:putative transcriptional regulator